MFGVLKKSLLYCPAFLCFGRLRFVAYALALTVKLVRYQRSIEIVKGSAYDLGTQSRYHNVLR